MGVVVAILLANKTEDTPEEIETPTAEVESRLIYDLDPKKILSIIISNEFGTYEIGRFNVDGSDVWSIEEFSAVSLDRNFIISILNNSASFTAARVITDTPTDLSVYGLDKPRADVLTVFDDGTIKNVMIGDPTPTAGETYAMIGDSDAVYSIKSTTVAPFLEEKFSAVNHIIYNALPGETAEQQLAATIINKMTIQREDLPYEMVIEFDAASRDTEKVSSNSSSYRLTSPVTLNLNPDTSETLMTKVFGLTADKVIAVQPDEATVAEYGLDAPYCTVIMDNVSGPFTMFVGDEVLDENGKVTGRYGIVEGVDVLYTFPIASLPWATVMPIDITASIITTNYIYDLDGVDFYGSGFDEKFALTGTSDEDFAVTKGGAAIDPAEFKKLYQFLLRASAEELYIEDTTLEPVMTVTVYGDGVEDIIEFIPTEDRRSIIRLNGQVCFKCKTAYVNRLIDNLGFFNAGEPLIMTW